MFPAGSGGTVELLLIPFGYLIRSYDGGGLIIHIVDHLNLEAWSAPEILCPLYELSKDVDGTLVWSTSTANKFVSGIKILDTGNLVLHDISNQTVWQSFDHPTDALLPGQKLRAGQRLVARVSSSNWTEGNYYISVNNQGLFASYAPYKPQMYFKFLVSGERDSFGESYVKAVNGTLALYISSTEPDEPNVVFSRPSRMKFLRYDYDGHLRAYSGGSDQPNDLLANFISFCDYPTACGSLELCSKGFCSCPVAFIRSNDRQNNV